MIKILSYSLLDDIKRRQHQGFCGKNLNAEGQIGIIYFYELKLNYLDGLESGVLKQHKIHTFPCTPLIFENICGVCSRIK